MHLKPLFTLSTVILLCLALNSLFAQPAQFRSQINQMQMNQQMQFQNQMMMQTLNMRGVKSTLEEYDFVATLRDSTKKEITSAIYTDSITQKRFIVLIDKKYKKSDTNRYKKIYPSETLKLTRVLEPKDDDNGTPGTYLNGLPNDTCWMFKVISGRINAYSYSCDYSNIRVLPIAGIQLNNGPIVQFNRENLWQMIISNENAVEYFKNTEYRKAILRYNKDVEKAAKK